jgi:hypothetical protein
VIFFRKIKEKKVLKKTVIIISFLLFFSLNIFPLSMFVRNSSDGVMQIMLQRASDKTTVYKDKIPKYRTVKISRLNKGTYFLFHRPPSEKNWRIMTIVLLRSGKVFVLF